MRYHYTTYIVFDSQKLLHSAQPLSDIISVFRKRGVYPDENVIDFKNFPATYKKENYLISSESNEYFNFCFKIESSCKTYAEPKYSDFLTLFQDILFQDFEVDFFDIEFFSEEDFNNIKQNFKNRFLSRKSMGLFVEKKEASEVKVELSKSLYSQDYVSFYKSRLKKSEFISDEHVWYSISKALDCYGDEITCKPFIPITYKDYYSEALNYCNYYQISIEEFFISIEEDGIQSILQVDDTLHYREYLLKYKSEYLYILIELNVP